MNNDVDDIMDGDLTELEISESESSTSEGVDGESDFEMDRISTSDSSSEDEDSDFEVETKPPAKRRKVDGPKLKTKTNLKSTGTPKAKAATQKQGRLQNMLTMPLDVLFELFSNLTPGDLVNLTRTSKNLRAVLMSRKSISVWRAARAQVPGLEVPEPPEDMSEPAWAQLLYGGAVCSECGAKNIHKIDFALRRRLCTKCMKQCLVYASSFRNKCPGLDPSVMEYLPYTNTGGWAHGHASSSRFYMKSDLLAMGKKLAELAQDKKAMKEFRKERILLVDAIMQDCAGYTKWATEAANLRSSTVADLKKKRYDDVVQRLLNAGYEKVDITNSQYTRLRAQPGVDSDKELTDQVWKHIRGKIEAVVINGRAERLKDQHERAVWSRRADAVKRYNKFCQLILPAQWAYMPNTDQAVGLTCFQEVYDKEADVTSADWTSAMQKLPQCLSEWMKKKHEEYIAMLPPANFPSMTMALNVLSGPSADVVRREKMASYAGALELALSVFTTDNHRALFGRDTCNTWKLPSPPTFSLRGASAVLSLFKTLAMNANLVTATALDHLNRRFVCLACAQKDHKSIDNLTAYSWRECVEHYMQTENSDHPSPQWRVLEPRQTADIILREKRLPSSMKKDSTRNWLCNHCGQYSADADANGWVFNSSNSLQTRNTVVHHLRTVHHIAAPVDDVDLLYHVEPGDRRPIAEPVLVNPRQTVPQPAQSTTQFRCAHCRAAANGGSASTRLFKLDGLKNHVQAKHKINRALEPGIDYY
ncbi:hypothetical protein BV25DRAFT_1826808 [Artomyces pyxidatus]|uniref:Uncharacterized protein n=1 Tax=Artomyces pyxidatus TaxID=48021 RepID=A0ACB8SYQ5_9AGAM|nr:hypothetical protein BV25DRAFT_1826808 [Artomyces pyxidatus]